MFHDGHHHHHDHDIAFKTLEQPKQWIIRIKVAVSGVRVVTKAKQVLIPCLGILPGTASTIWETQNPSCAWSDI